MAQTEQMFNQLDDEGLTRSSRIEDTRVIEMARDGKEVALGIVSLTGSNRQSRPLSRRS